VQRVKVDTYVLKPRAATQAESESLEKRNTPRQHAGRYGVDLRGVPDGRALQLRRCYDRFTYVQSRIDGKLEKHTPNAKPLPRIRKVVGKHKVLMECTAQHLTNARNHRPRHLHWLANRAVRPLS
jgi:hypothetical protein